MTTGELKRATVAIALLALVLALAAITPFALLAAAIWGLVALCTDHTRRVKRELGPERLRQRPGLRYHLCAFGVLYLVPIGAATTFYCLLAVYLDLFSDSTSVGRLMSMQRTFERISTFFSGNLKLSESAVLGVLVVVYLLTCILLARRKGRGTPDAGHGWRFRAAHTLNRGTEFYTRYSGPVAAGLATLASFSLFGMQLGVPATDLELRLKVAQEGYAELTRKVEADLSGRVASGLYAKVYNGLPASYRHTLTQQVAVGGLVDGVRAHAEQARSRYNVSVPSVDTVVRDELARRARIDALPADLRVEATGRADTPGDATPEQVESARSARVNEPGGQGIDLVTDGRRTMTLHLEKLVSERILALTKPLTEAVPILEPVLQAFAEAADRTLQDRLGQAYDRLVDVAVRNPQDLDAAVGREARTIVGQTDVRAPVARATPRAERLAESHRLTVSLLHNGNNLIDQKVGEALASRTRTRPRTPLALPELLRPWPLLTPYYDTPRFGYGQPPYTYRPPETYRLPPRTVQPPRPVRPVPRIFVW
ncbi:hypothetical protein ACTMS0_01350 [Micromonospora sp. H33]|uniref:hypothetical protein n=1 Tax=Micromonospora sp. H33 TaxID=3452215 RepID=UPI003F899187